MSGSAMGGLPRKSFRNRELAESAMLVRQSMLNALPEPEACEREFSPEFQEKMTRLFVYEKTRNKIHRIRRYAAAIILMILVSGGIVLAVDAEARASFFEWVKKIYENSITYEFFNDPQEEGLPVYELGWVPEGYEAVDVYHSDTLHSALYQNGDDVSAAFVFEYCYGHSGSVMKLIGDISQYEHKEIVVNGISVEFYRALKESDTNALVWVDERDEIIFMLNGYLSEDVMLHMIENAFLGNSTK